MEKNYSKLARETGLSVSHVSRVMRGLRTPSVRTLLLLSKALGLPIDKMLTMLELNKEKRNEVDKAESNVGQDETGGQGV